MKDLHSWKVNVEEAIQIQEALRDRVILRNTFNDVTKVGGADVSYSKDKNFLYAAIIILSFPGMETLEIANAHGKIPFPYIPGLLSFREGPVLIRAFQKLTLKPDLMIFDGQGVAHPRGFGLASHMGLWLDLPSIGCTKTPLLRDFVYPETSKGSFELIRKGGKDVGVVLRTKENIKPLFVSPGHRIDLGTSMKIVLTACTKFRIPEPLRKAHQLSRLPREKSFFP
jgi:deoxyribonuclease V